MIRLEALWSRRVRWLLKNTLYETNAAVQWQSSRRR